MKIFKKEITLIDFIIGVLILTVILGFYIVIVPSHTKLTKCLLSDLEEDVWVEGYFFYKHKTKNITLEVTYPYRNGYLKYGNGEKIRLTENESFILDNAIDDFIDNKREKEYEALQKQVEKENEAKVNEFLKQCGN